MAKYDYNKVKKDFIDKMLPFVEGIKRFYSDNDIKGTIFFRECTLNGDDYIGEYSNTDDLNELFDVIWKEYFLNGEVNFNKDSEFTFDCYFDCYFDGGDYNGCYFIYEKDSLDMFWCGEFDKYLGGAMLIKC